MRLLRLLVVAAALAGGPALAATNFLWAPGTSNNGEIGSVLTLLSTEMNSLASGSVAASTVGGTSGVFSNSDTSQAIWAEVFANLGTAGGACAAGGNISGWFLSSSNGSTFEPTSAAPARAPDFIVPLPQTTLNATYKAMGLVRVPALKFKVLVQNNCGNAFAASANTITLAPTAVQY